MKAEELLESKFSETPYKYEDIIWFMEEYGKLKEEEHQQKINAIMEALENMKVKNPITDEVKIYCEGITDSIAFIKLYIKETQPKEEKSNGE